MTRRLLAIAFAALASGLLPACSAVVSPDPGRLGGSDGGTPGEDAPGVTCTGTEIVCDGRCVDPSADESACGGCGRTCTAAQTCVSGVCTCTPGSPGCGVVDPGLGDPAACGASRVRCGVGELCLGGVCTCRPGLTPVSGECVDLLTDPSHCGVPGMRCPEACRAGVCAASCSDALTNCDGACVSLRRDPLNCGECGRVCNGREVCLSGSCREVSPATGCTSCPCDACDRLCCTLPTSGASGVPYCLNEDACP